MAAMQYLAMSGDPIEYRRDLRVVAYGALEAKSDLRSDTFNAADFYGGVHSLGEQETDRQAQTRALVFSAIRTFRLHKRLADFL